MRVPNTSKHLKVDKASSRSLAIVAVSAVIVVFCAFSIKALLAQGAYQRRVVNAKHDTVKQLQNNISAAKDLSKQYDVFEASNPNAIGGKSDVPDNVPPPDGRNSRIILDALPVQYDFPALISSLTKLLTMDGIANPSLGGTDQSASFSNEPQADPQPIVISQIPISGTSSYGGVQTLIGDLERSIRPYDVTSLQISFNDDNLASLTLSLDTFYQPAKAIIIESKEIK